MKYIYIHVYTYIVNAKKFFSSSPWRQLISTGKLCWKKNQSHLFKVVIGKLGRLAGSRELSGGR